MIDLHCHLLPGVDDGARTLEDAIELVRLARASGITGAVVTPHVHPEVWDNSSASLRRVFIRLVEALAASGIDFPLALGAEIRLHPDTMASLEARRLPLLGRLDGVDIALIEFPDGMIPPGALHACRAMIGWGIRPMLAHPERNKAVMRDPACIRPFVDAGCLLQLTAASITGHFGTAAKSASLTLLAQGLVSVVATDAHNRVARPPRLHEARDALARLYGHAVADRLTLEVPGLIASGHRDGWRPLP
jgi:protein-tyrosine phosphatase